MFFTIKRHCIAFLLLALPLLLACASHPPKPDGEENLEYLTEKEEIQFGNYVDEVVTSTYSILKDESLTRSVAGIGNGLASVSDRPHLPFTFKVINTTEINAFAGPGGYVYVTVGLLDILESREELAAVMAHEIGHVCERHSIRSWYTAQKISAVLAVVDIAAWVYGAPPVAALGGDLIGDFTRIVANLTGLIVYRGYGRSWETKADELGLHYSSEAGYDPHSIVRVLERFLKLEEEKGEKIKLTILSSHPKTKDRIEHIKLLIEQKGAR
jgi:predicted Zn-dependent protease